MRASLRLVAGALVLGGLASSGLAGCTSVKNGLGRHESICFSTIPQARAIVGNRSSFDGVRYESPDALRRAFDRRHHRHARLPRRFAKHRRHPACLVAFRDHLPAGLVARSWRLGPGPYRVAIIVIRLDSHRLLGTVVTRKPPLGFQDFG